MRQLFLYLMFGMVILIAMPAGAKFYTFKDQNGVIIFTDDLSQVPEDQRPGVKTFESATESHPKDKKVEKTAPAPDSKENRLEKQKKWLINEQNALNLESDELKSLKKTAATPEKLEEYNNKVQTLNKRIEKYTEKLANLKRFPT